MEKIGLITDDICSLPQELINKYKIELVKTKLFFPEWERCPQKNLYQVMKETEAYPKTSAPSLADFLRAYKKQEERFEKIIVLTLSSQLSSATYNAAYQAKQLMPDPSKFEIFDSGQVVAPQGLMVVKTAEMIKAGKAVSEILKCLENLKGRAKLFASLGTIFWVEKSGRITAWQAKAFNFLKKIGIQPIIGTKNGRVGLTGFNFWTRDTLKAIFNQIKYFKNKYRKIKVGINYTDNVNLAYKLKEKIQNELKTEVTFTSIAPPIVGANSGPGTLFAGGIPDDTYI
jgi:DegV family protein with EDD domain